MPDEGTALVVGLGIEVFANGDHEPAGDEEYAPASGPGWLSSGRTR